MYKKTSNTIKYTFCIAPKPLLMALLARSLPSYHDSQGEDLGPLELKIDTLQKQMAESLEQCTQMQQFWLRQQNDLVRKSKAGEEQAHSFDSLKKQLLILDQKKLRTDGKEPALPLSVETVVPLALHVVVSGPQLYSACLGVRLCYRV